MANLPFKTIKLLANPEAVQKGQDAEYKTYYSTEHIPLRVTLNAVKSQKKLMDSKGTADEAEMIEWMINIVVKDIYKGQFTEDELLDGLHAATAMETLQEQLAFAMGGGKSDTKKFVESQK